MAADPKCSIPFLFIPFLFVPFLFIPFLFIPFLFIPFYQYLEDTQLFAIHLIVILTSMMSFFQSFLSWFFCRSVDWYCQSTGRAGNSSYKRLAHVLVETGQLCFPRWLGHLISYIFGISVEKWWLEICICDSDRKKGNSIYVIEKRMTVRTGRENTRYQNRLGIWFLVYFSLSIFFSRLSYRLRALFPRWALRLFRILWIKWGPRWTFLWGSFVTYLKLITSVVSAH